MAEKLAFVEVAEQLAHVPTGYHVVSLSPLAEVALERAGRSYTRPEDYLDEMALEEAGIANFTTVEALCAALDGIFADSVPEVAEHELKPARWHYYWPIKIVYDAFFLRAYQLRRVLATEAPREVLYFQRSQPDLSREWISQSESLYACLLDHLLPALEIAGKRLSSVPEQKVEEGGMLGSIGLLLRRVRRSASWRFQRIQKTLEMLRRVLPRRSGGRVLCVHYNYNIPYITRELERLGYEVWIWRDMLTAYRVGPLNEYMHKAAVQLPDSRRRAIWTAVKAASEVRGLFCWEGYDLWSTVAPRLYWLVKRGLPEVINHYAAAESVLKQIQPDVVLMSTAAYAWEKAICHAAQRRGIPSVDSAHGIPGCQYSPMDTHRDLESVDWLLCPGRWVEQYVQRYRKKEIRTVVVGSPMIEAATKTAPLRDIIRSQLGYAVDQKVILYVLHAMPEGNYWYASYRYPSDNSYFRLVQRIVQALLNLDDWKVVLKEHPATVDSSLEKWCRSIDVSGRVSVIRQPGFDQLIHLADVVVLDQASTRLAQALTGSARIYMVDLPSFRWEPGVVEHLASAEVVFCTVADLEERIRTDIMAGLIGNSQRYMAETIEPMVTVSSGPGGAARRAAYAVVQIAAETDAQIATCKAASGSNEGNNIRAT